MLPGPLPTKARCRSGDPHQDARPNSNVLQIEGTATNAPTSRKIADSTDHGEVQDNDGEYPGSRDEPLTAVIFKVPTDANGLTLPNDADALATGGYVFAEGIRNCYDLAFAPNGHLFCVSNSSDYDHPEDMFWLRQGRHYGFPWVMGNLDNPQQFPDFDPDDAFAIVV